MWWKQRTPKGKNPKDITLPYKRKGKLWGFFNSACQQILSICEDKVVLYFDTTHYLYLKYATKIITNNRENFYALWIFLKTTHHKRYKPITSFKRLQLVIEWANQHYRVGNIDLNHILNQIQEVKLYSIGIPFTHVYLEFDTLDD